MPYISRPRSVAAATYHAVFSPDGYVQLDGGAAGRSQARFLIEDRRIAAAFSGVLAPPLTDLIDVALAAYTIDRLAPRPRRGRAAPEAWSRQLRLVVPVSDPVRWSGELYGPLLAALSYLTEDIWEFEFVPRKGLHDRAPVQIPLFEFDSSPPLHAALFSGGLDSFAGLYEQVTQQPEGTLVLFAGAPSPRIQGRQKMLIEAVRERLGRTGPRLVPCIVPYRLTDRPRSDADRDERTQRTRGFIYAAFGAAAATLAGARDLAFFENGIGCINLPYTRAQVGVEMTRATHPLALQRMQEFMSAVLGHPFQFRLPNLLRTKAQICQSLRGSGLEDLVGKTLSCDVTLRERNGKLHCGTCTSCILRRQSLIGAGLGAYDGPGPYVRDVFVPDALALGEKRLVGLRAMHHQVRRLRYALSDRRGSAEGLRAEFPELHALDCLDRTGTLVPSVPTVDDLVTLYRQYCEEWELLPPEPPFSTFQDDVL